MRAIVANEWFIASVSLPPWRKNKASTLAVFSAFSGKVLLSSGLSLLKQGRNSSEHTKSLSKTQPIRCLDSHVTSLPARDYGILSSFGMEFASYMWVRTAFGFRHSWHVLSGA